jgi:arylsulfatase
LLNENIYVYRKTEPTDVVVPAALYHLRRDPGEQKSVLNDHPNIAKRLRGYLAAARADLGDALTGVKPTNVRPVGQVEDADGN